MDNEAIHPAVRVGHVHLRVADLDRALRFYRDALGFGVSADARQHGLDMVLLAAGELVLLQPARQAPSRRSIWDRR